MNLFALRVSGPPPRVVSLKNALLLIALLCCSTLLPSQLAAQGYTPIPGTTPVGASAPVLPVIVTFTRGGTPGSVKVLSTGAAGLDFQDAGSGTCSSSTTFAPGQTCTVNVQFKPIAPGSRRGAIVVLDAGNQQLAKQNLVGTASGPLAIFVPGEITTVAGTAGAFFFAGDGKLATRAALFLPFGITVDAAGNLYIADTYNSRIRKVDATTGIINTIAGNGTLGYSGDNGPALAAAINHPSSVAIDPAGYLYIADTGNNVVRLYNPFTGSISTLAGNGTGGYSGDGGAATAATLQSPNGLALDLAGNLFIADTGNNVVREVGVNGVISTVAGTGTAAYTGDGGTPTRAGLKAPWGVTVTDTGDIYIADQGNNVVRRVSAGTISTIAGDSKLARPGFAGDGGLATAPAVRLNTPSAVLFDVAGNMYISDSGNNRIRKINARTKIITSIAGGHGDPDGYPADTASISAPYAEVMDGAGNLFISDTLHNRIRKVLSNQAILNFDPQRVNSVSANLSQVIENDGTLPLTISGLAAVSNATIDPSTSCSSGATLAPLAQCTIVAAFAPTVTGNPVTGTVRVDSNSINTPSNLLLQGIVESTYPSTVLLSATPDPAIVGQEVTFAVQVVSAGGIVATGKVTLLDGTDTLATLPLVNGVASTNISTLALGKHTITASYTGDVNNNAAVSSPVIEVIQAAPVDGGTTTSLTSSANPSAVGSTVTFTATVTSVAGNSSLPTGTLTFLDGSTVLGTAPLAAGKATLSVSTLTQGTHSITAKYGGSGSYTASVSAPLSEVILAGGVSQFSFVVTPSTVSLASGARTTLAVVFAPSSAYTGTLLLGCGGLPAEATCTFSQQSVQLPGDAAKTISVTLDTGNPLGSGSSTKVSRSGSTASKVLVCGLPIGFLLMAFVGRRRRDISILRLCLGLVMMSTLTVLSGCSASLDVKTTSPGTYDLQVFASNPAGTVTYAVPVHLTVTK